MSKKPVHDQKPWEPILDTLPVFNPFVNPAEHLGDVPSGAPVEDEETETTPETDEIRNDAGQPASTPPEK